MGKFHRHWSRAKSGMSTFRRSRFVRNVATVATGVAAAQAISLVFMPLLTRLYGPEAFGALAAFSAVVNIITPLATLGFANAIVMGETDEEAAAIARLSLWCAAIVTPLVLLVVLFFGPTLAEWTGLEDTPGFLYLIPIAIVLTALLSVADQTAIRNGLFNAKAKSKVASTLVMNAGKLIGGLTAPAAWVLILLETLGKAINFSMLLLIAPRQGAFQVKRWFGARGVLAAAIKHRDFAIFRMPQSVINAAAYGLPVLLLTSFFGAEYAGQYSLTTLVLGAPVVLLGQSVGEVFYPKITSLVQRRSPHALRQTASATLVLGCVAAVPFGAVMLFGPDLFAFVLGAEWRRAGEYAQWIAPWLGLTLITRPILATFPVLRLQSYLLFQEIFSVAARIGVFLVGINIWESDRAAVALFALIGVFLMCMHNVVGFWKLRRETRKWASEAGAVSVRGEAIIS